MNFEQEVKRFKQRYVPKGKDLLPEVYDLREKFQKYHLDEAEPFTWKLFNDYIAFVKLGVPLKAQRAKIVEAIFKFGKDSLFFQTLRETKEQRKLEWIRCVVAARVVTANLASKNENLHLNRRDKNKTTLFLKRLIDFRRKLMVNPLTEKQWHVLWEVERVCGIYYTDLTPEENGEIWRLEVFNNYKQREPDESASND